MQVATRLVSPFAGWLVSMLQTRGLQQPDGRPLYRYRLTEAEFDSLAQLLNSRAQADIHLLAKQNGFCACWFLFAAEWWRRQYAGGAWAWGPILQGAGIRQEVSHNTRGDWVNVAVAYWQLDDKIASGKRFLGRVVSNGGLPLRLLHEAASGVTRLLNMVQHEMAVSRVPMSDEQVLAALTEGARYLPESYRQKHVLELLAEVLQTVKRLNGKLGSAEGEDPVARLDRLHPGWIDEFPLQLAPEHARSLLGGLVRRAQANTETRLFHIVRQLRFDSQGRPARLETVLETANRIEMARLLCLLGWDGEIEDHHRLPASIDLVLVCDMTSLPVGRLNRRDGVYQIHVERPSLPSSWLGQDIRLELSRFGESLGHIELPGGDAPDTQQPWVFEDSVPVARLLGVGSMRLRDSRCIVLSSPEATVFHLLEDPVSLGMLNEMQVVRSGSGALTVTMQAISYQIVCGDSTAREAGTLVWYGRQLAHCQSIPSRVFAGDEDAYEVLPSGERRKIPRSELFWQFERGKFLPFTGPRQPGCGWLIWKQASQIKNRVKAVCLPPTAKIRIEPETNGLNDGAIVLQDWPVVSVSVLSDTVAMQATRSGNDWTLRCRKLTATPPVSLMLALRWPGGATQRLTLPYPVDGAFLYNDQGEAVTPGQQLSVADLLHLNIRVQCATQRRWKVYLQLLDSHGQELTAREFPVRFAADSIVTDLRLFELQNDVLELLASVDELDAQVRISIRRDGSERCSLMVARYRHRLLREPGHVALSHIAPLPADEILRSTRLLALPMLAPDSQPLELEARQSELACTGRWVFDEARVDPGVWLIYPASGTALDCRPIAWYVPPRFAGPAPRYEGLLAAMTLTSRPERLTALCRQFDIMADNPSHPDWQRVRQYVNQLGHLPLAGLDLWVALSQCPRAVIMALLIVDEFADRIAHRLSGELPFEWILTAPQDWLAAVSIAASSLAGTDERERRMLRREFEVKLEWLRRIYPSMELSISLALSRGLLRKQSPEVELLLAEPESIRHPWLERLVGAECSDVQCMLQRVSGAERGPAELKSYARRFADSVRGKQLLKNFRVPQDDWKYPLAVVPLAVAYDIAEGRVPDWLGNRGRMVALRNYRSFDAHWFDEAYKVALVCAFDDGLINV
ncbi:STY4851/ECs_5259 family protein [Aquitalea pelogenes]|uniref:STY4851/ECs_5259 family protein n=1 Tax=Aquitalea pelogenes TaxID=1293573 RepID=UPI00078874AB|nr:STY4851/ECs_5259 family protein [Aquitalea pelogenes]